MVPRIARRLLSPPLFRAAALALASALGVAAGTAPAAAQDHLPPDLVLTADGLPVGAAASLPPGPRRDALLLGRDMIRAARAGDLAEARALRREFLAMDPEVLADVPWPPVIDAIGATEEPPDLDSLELWTGALPDDDELILVFWRPRRGDKRRLFAALDAEVAAGGLPVVAIVAEPTAKDQQLAQAQARLTPGIAVGRVDGAAALRWQAELSQDCLYIADGVVQQRLSCRALLGPELSATE